MYSGSKKNSFTIKCGRAVFVSVFCNKCPLSARVIEISPFFVIIAFVIDFFV